MNLARHADGRIVCADSSIGWGNGVRRRKNGENGGRGEATGGAEAPPQVGACFVFIMISGLLFLFVDPSLEPVASGISPRLGVQ